MRGETTLTTYASLKDKVAIVTGGASGIGLVTAKLFAASGARVVLADYALDRAREQAQQLVDTGAQALAFGADISQPQAVANLFDYTRDELGPVQILVNAAGIAGPNMPAVEVSYEAWQRTLAVNLTGTFLCCQAALKQMLEGGYGKIVNVASIAGKEGNPNLAAYSATKGAVIALTKSLAKEVAQRGIYVNCLAPAVIDTPMNKDVTPQMMDYMVSKIPLGRIGQPEEVAELIAWIASDACSFTTGFCFDISGGRATY
jgi:NAD(P)-dependent dehydrogenase (short-subunit alcohol dehydrogenase family)